MKVSPLLLRPLGIFSVVSSDLASFVYCQVHAKPVSLPDLYEASILQLQAGLDAGHFSSVDLVKVSRFLVSFSRKAV